ncbi:MAG: zinc-ribbon domain containing protein [Pseudomonadota bacterium]
MPAGKKTPKLSKAEKRERRRNRKRYQRLSTGRAFVDHPRYGDAPIRSATPITAAEMRASYWGYNRTHIPDAIYFPETAIRADRSRQRTGWGWRPYYVDIARRCRKCRRWFLFFALEQKYWYETLGFFIDADCVDCQECRHDRHEQRAFIHQYEALLARPDKSQREWSDLEQLGQHLFEIGYVRKAESLLKTRPPKRFKQRA